MKHNFVWKIPTTEPLKSQLVVWDALERAMTYDRHMSNALVVPGEDHLLVQFHYQGRDRWWIHQRARYAAVAVMVRAKLPVKQLTLEKTEHLRNGHDLRGEARTERQQAADHAKTKHARWERLKAQRAAS